MQRELQVGVKAVLKNKQGKILLNKRSAKKYPETANRWDIVGGRIEAGSDLMANLVREIKEETGLDFNGPARLIAAQDILRVPDKHIVRLTYAGEIEGEPRLSDESLEFRWFTLQEIKALPEAELDIYFRALIDAAAIP